ncbi:MAG TPA: histidine kinase [Runella sp.]|nr:histidine kinase [Runella sp.]
MMSKPFKTSCWILFSYFAIWYVAMAFECNGEWSCFLSAIAIFSWAVAFIALLNLFLFHQAIPWIRKQPKRWGWSTLLVVGMLFMLTFGFAGWCKFAAYVFGLDPLNDMPFTLKGLSTRFFFQVVGIIYFTLVKLIVESYELRLHNQRLVIEKQQSELSFLKSQINPHFLFNTLNNIYALAREKSDQAPHNVLRLSEMLRYMLYETGGGLVSADKEIKIIEDYLELERMRYDETLNIQFKVQLEESQTLIPPLLMIPLVENAFKHGVSETLQQAFVHIRLAVSQQELRLEIENSKEENEESTASQEGIGIRNIRRQLELLFHSYQLQLENRGQTFFTQLTIDLNSYAKN